MQRFTATFEFERETKNTIRYAEELGSGPPRIGTLYVQKWALGDPPPRRLVVDVRMGDPNRGEEASDGDASDD